MERGRQWREMARYDSSLFYYRRASALFLDVLESEANVPTWEQFLLCQAWIGENFCAMGIYDSALIQGSFVEKVALQKIGPVNEALAQTYNLLGSTYLDLSDIEEARSYHQRALEVRKELFGDSHLEVSHSYDYLGNVYSEEGDFDQALAYHKKALALRSLPSNRKPRFLAYSHINLAYSYSDLGKTTLALKHYSQAETYLKEIYTPDHPNFGIIYNNLGIIYQELGQYDACLTYFQKTREIYLKAYGELSPQLLDWELNMGNVHYDNGNYLEAQKHWEKTRIRIESLSQAPKRKLRGVYQNLSLVWRQLGDLDQAESYQLKSLELARDIFPETHPAVASHYTNLGLIAQDRGKSGQAINFFVRSLDIQLEALPYPHMDMGRTYSNLGMIEQVRGNFQEGMTYLQTALAIYLELQGELNDNVAIVYTNMGAIALSEGNFAEGRRYLEKSNVIYQQLFGENHVSIASNLSNFALIMKEEGKKDSALFYYQQALDIYQQVYTGPHYEIAQIQWYQAEILWEQGRKEEANALIQAALTQVGIQEDRALDFSSLLHQGLALRILQSRVKMLTQSSEDPAPHLKRADTLLEMCFALLSEYRKKLPFEESELSLQQLVSPLFDLAVHTQLDLYEATHEYPYLEKAFYYSEKGKAYLLQRRLRMTADIEFAGLPDTLLRREGQLQMAFAFQHQEMRNALNTHAPDFLLEDIRKNLWKIEQEMDSLNTFLATHFPSYYELKYAEAVVGLAPLQAHLKKDSETVLLSYHWGIERAVLFKVEGDAVHYTRFPVSNSLIDELSDFYTLLNDKEFITAEDRFAEGRASYARLGHSLFQSLLPLGLPDPTEFPKVHIIPDGILGYIPFETLLDSYPLSTSSYKSFPYLIQSYDITYNYSATLWIQGQQKAGMGNLSYGGFAPSYADTLDVFFPSRKEEIQGVPMGAFSELRYNQLEVAYVANLMEGVSFLGPEATESRFKDEIKEVSVVHLAMHGFYNEEDPFHSGLAFSSDGDSINDGFLYAHELYGMDLDLDLAVLSACYSGVGSLARGEGIMSLSRAFTYAGCPNIIASYWQADDKGTQDLMLNFFQGFKNGEPTAQALRKAKLSLLQAASEMEAHPSHWAAWVLIGNPDSTSSSYPSPKWLFIGLFSALILGGGIFTLLNKARHS